MARFGIRKYIWIAWPNRGGDITSPTRFGQVDILHFNLEKISGDYLVINHVSFKVEYLDEYPPDLDQIRTDVFQIWRPKILLKGPGQGSYTRFGEKGKCN